MQVSWDQPVRLFYTGADLRVVSHELTLREAVDAFEAMPRSQKSSAGIALHEPEFVVIDGRPALRGFLNAAAIQELVRMTAVSVESGALSDRA